MELGNGIGIGLDPGGAKRHMSMKNVAMHQPERRVGISDNIAQIYKKAVGEKGGKVMKTGNQLLGVLISQNDLGEGIPTHLFSENVAKY